MLYEQLPDEWKEWVDLPPLERFRLSQQMLAEYLASGGTLDPDPDPTSPFYDEQAPRSVPAYGGTSMRVLRRGAV